MLNYIGKCLLGATTLAPLGFIYSYLFYRKGFLNESICILLISISLILLCLWFIKYIKDNIQQTAMRISTVEAGDRENIAFILLYAMPIFTGDVSTINIDAIVATVILLLVFFSGGYYYHFNPVLMFFKWHFYKISTPEGVSYLLITKRQIRNNNDRLMVHKFSEYIVIDGD